VRRHERTGENGDGKPGGRHDYEVLIAHHDTIIEPDDHVIVFAVNKRTVPDVEKLFQVDVRFV
jgi:trk system potassium uptake protein TrkA